MDIPEPIAVLIKVAVSAAAIAAFCWIIYQLWLSHNALHLKHLGFVPEDSKRPYSPMDLGMAKRAIMRNRQSAVRRLEILESKLSLQSASWQLQQQIEDDRRLFYSLYRHYRVSLHLASQHTDVDLGHTDQDLRLATAIQKHCAEEAKRLAAAQALGT